MVVLMTLVLMLLGAAAPAIAQKEDRESLAFFENDIRPLLIQRCVKCHGPKKAESGLRLDTRATAIQGGDSGPGIVPGRADASLIIKAVRHEDDLEMPPNGKLKNREVGALERWIQAGAAWPEGMSLGGVGPKVRGGKITDQERAFWSFQPVADPQPPQVQAEKIPAGQIKNDIDRFVFQKLREAELTPMGPADKRVLLRRATFDLTGLPPTPEAMRSFLEDASPEAFSQTVDKLLASKAYGERWGRHWLDVVRYSDTAGETADYPTPLSYKYRNWVINALNADMPYDQFVREQIAGDILARQIPDLSNEQYQEMLTATGFIAISRRFGYDVENYHNLTIQDTIDTVGQAFLGLTLGCARCHDHKYDPVSTADYYGWYGIFESTRYSFPGSEEKKRPYDLFPALPPAEAKQVKAEYDAALAKLEASIKEKELADLGARRDAMREAGPYGLVYAAIEKDGPKNTRIQLRGDKLKLSQEAPRNNLEIFGDDPLPDDAGSGRLQLAHWLTRESNPLMARVMVNRIWQHHFGRGLVDSANDFGARGERPTHPALLDWLASRFKENGYSIKAMHRLILASAAYQRSSEYNATAAESDPDSKLLWRFNRRRLSAEEIRDAMLLVSGNLDPTMGGEHPFPAVKTWAFTQHSPYYGVYPINRRSVYLMQQRLRRHPFLSLFDGADTNASTAHRELTTVPTQALYLMNNAFVHTQSEGLAKQILKRDDGESARIERIFQIALGRSPSRVELADTSQFLQIYAEALAWSGFPAQDRPLAAWSGLARTMFMRNGFLFVD